MRRSDEGREGKRKRTEDDTDPSEPIERLKRWILLSADTVNDRLREADPDMTKVLVVGITGSGKTTLLHCLAGRRMAGVEDKHHRIVLDVCAGEEHLGDEHGPFGIGHNVDAETFRPNVWVDAKNHLIISDSPGFVDTDRYKRLANAFSIDKILEIPGKVKVLLVVSVFQFEEKGIQAFEAFEMLCQLFPNQRQLEQMIGVVVTKTRTENPVDLLERLAEGEDRENPLIQFLIREGRDRIFTFPAAERSEFHFDDKDRLIEFLRRGAVMNPEHQVAIDEKTVSCTQSLFRNYMQETDSVLMNITEQFDNASKSVSVDELKKSQDECKLLIESGRKGFREFCSCCERISSLQCHAAKLSEIRCWDEFISRQLSRVPKLKALHRDWRQKLETTVNTLRRHSERLGENVSRIEEKQELNAKISTLEKQVEDGKITKEMFDKQIEEMKMEMEKREKEHAENEKRLNDEIANLTKSLNGFKADKDKGSMLREGAKLVKNITGFVKVLSELDHDGDGDGDDDDDDDYDVDDDDLADGLADDDE